MLENYRRERALDVRARCLEVDGLNRAVASDAIPVSLICAAGLRLLAAVPLFRRTPMRAMLQPVAPPARLSRAFA